jgi:hypothetical protein
VLCWWWYFPTVAGRVMFVRFPVIHTAVTFTEALVLCQHCCSTVPLPAVFCVRLGLLVSLFLILKLGAGGFTVLSGLVVGVVFS